jgi:hypothetical protein
MIESNNAFQYLSLPIGGTRFNMTVYLTVEITSVPARKNIPSRRIVV